MERQPTALWMIAACCYFLAAVCPAFAQPQQQLENRTVRKPLINRAAVFNRGDQNIDDLLKQSLQLKEMIKTASPSVVHIEAIKPDDESSRADDTFTEAGAGVIIEYRDRYYVLTNLHVVKEADIDKISILLTDGRFFRPTALIADPDTDLALLQVRFPNLKACRIANSDHVEVGDFVIAVGSPFGLSHSTTFGMVSALGRRNLELGDEGVKYQNFIQTDASINPGNSGGPLMNLKGEVIGINTAIASNSGGSDGIGFCIPMNMAMRISKQLIDYGSVRRSYLGVTLDSDFTLDKAAQLGLDRFYGARVTKVTRNSPAFHAGFEEDDLILQFNGIDVQDDAHLVNIVSATPVGQNVNVVVMRNRRKVILNASVRGMRSM